MAAAFTPPAPTTAAQNSYAGCLVAPDDSVFNTPIDTLPVHPQSAAWIAQSLTYGAVGVSFGQFLGVNIVDHSVTPTAMTFHYTVASNGVRYPLLTGNNRNRETGASTTDYNNDHHMITLDHENCHWFETYQDNLTNSMTPAPAPYAASGWDYLGASYTQPTDGTTDAAGLPLMPLLVHLSEMQAGAIHHAMRFTSCQGCISNAFLWPATGSASYSSTSAPMGSRWRLKASYDDSALSPKARIITKALKTYGMVLSDNGGMAQIQVLQDVNLDPSASAAFNEVGSANITLDHFEIIDESSLMISTDSHQVLGGTPSSAPVLVGTPSPVIYPQSGTSYQLPSWVNGASDQHVVWSLVSGAGAVTPEGVYTAPSDVTAPEPFILKGVAEASSLNPVFISGDAMPAGTLRINVGNVWPYTDTNGNNWLADDFGVLSGGYMNNNATYPSNKWDALAPPPDGQTIWGWSKYTWGDDIQYGPFIVPNGTYSVQFWMAVDCPAGGQYSERDIFNNGLTRGGTVGLEINGAMSLFDIGGAVHDACRTPAMPTIQTAVTDNVLRVAVRSTSNGATQESPFLNALIITPVASQAVPDPPNVNPTPQLQISPTTLKFSAPVDIVSAPQAVVFKNTGSASLNNLSVGLTGENARSFQITGSNCAIVAAGASCTVSVVFAPHAAGSLSAGIAFTNALANSLQTIPVNGTATPSLNQLVVGADASIWSLDSTGKVYTYDVGSGSLQSKPGVMAQMAVGSSQSVWALAQDGTIYRWNPGSQTWDCIPGLLARIAVGADGDVWGISSGNQVWHFNSSTQNWGGVPGNLSQIVVGFNGAVWGLQPDGEIYRFSTSAGIFQKMPGLLSQIAVGADGDVWGINSGSQIQHFNPLLQNWENIPGSLAQISVGSANNVWGLNSSGNTLRFDTSSQNWTQSASTLKQICAGANGAVLGIDNQGTISQIVSANPAPPAFHRIPGRLAQLAVASDGNVWGIDYTGQTWHFNPLSQNWDRIPGTLSRIMVAAGGEVWGNTADGLLYRFTSVTQSWINIPGRLKQIAVGASNNVWGLSSDGHVWRFNTTTQNLDHIPGVLTQISVGSNQNVWGLSAHGQIWKFNPKSNNWDNIPGVLATISAASDGTVWGIDSGSHGWRFNSAIQTWDYFPGLLSQIAVSADLAIWGVDPNQGIYRFW